jgi:hypothetical protein
MKLQSTNKTKEAPPKFTGRFSKDGGLDFGAYTKQWLKTFIKENPNMPFELKPLLPESIKQRKFFEGAVCPLVAFYHEGLDHRDWKDIEKVREWLKIEFNGEFVNINNKIHKIAQSTKNKLNQGFLERVIDYVIENYAPPIEALDPEKYKHWRDTVFPFGGPDNYIDYLVELNILK